MDRGYKKIFWGIIFLSFHINLGSIKIIPSFIAWIIVLGGINALANEYKLQDFTQAIRYTNAIIVLTLIFDLVGILGIVDLGNLSIFNLSIVIIMTLELIILSKILDGSISFLKALGQEDKALGLVDSKNKYIKLYSLAIIMTSIGISLNIWIVMLVFGAIFSLIIRIYYLGLINNLRKEAKLLG